MEHTKPQLEGLARGLTQDNYTADLLPAIRLFDEAVALDDLEGMADAYQEMCGIVDEKSMSKEQRAFQGQFKRVLGKRKLKDLSAKEKKALFAKVGKEWEQNPANEGTYDSDEVVEWLEEQTRPDLRDFRGTDLLGTKGYKLPDLIRRKRRSPSWPLRWESEEESSLDEHPLLTVHTHPDGGGFGKPAFPHPIWNNPKPWKPKPPPFGGGLDWEQILRTGPYAGKPMSPWESSDDHWDDLVVEQTNCLPGDDDCRIRGPWWEKPYRDPFGDGGFKGGDWWKRGPGSIGDIGGGLGGFGGGGFKPGWEPTLRTGPYAGRPMSGKESEDNYGNLTEQPAPDVGKKWIVNKDGAIRMHPIERDAPKGWVDGLAWHESVGEQAVGHWRGKHGFAPPKKNWRDTPVRNWFDDGIDWTPRPPKKWNLGGGFTYQPGYGESVEESTLRDWLNPDSWS